MEMFSIISCNATHRGKIAISSYIPNLRHRRRACSLSASVIQYVPDPIMPSVKMASKRSVYGGTNLQTAGLKSGNNLKKADLTKVGGCSWGKSQWCGQLFHRVPECVCFWWCPLAKY